MSEYYINISKFAYGWLFVAHLAALSLLYEPVLGICKVVALGYTIVACSSLLICIHPLLFVSAICFAVAQQFGWGLDFNDSEPHTHVEVATETELNTETPETTP